MSGITSLEVENFRCFKKLDVAGLTSVNLFVGAGNAGKTALLEAIEAVVSSDSPDRVSVHRLESGRETPVRFAASRIAENVEMELETRSWPARLTRELTPCSCTGSAGQTGG